MRYKALIFDFDYTLGDSTIPIVASAQGALRKMGWPPAERDAIRRTIGHTLQDAFTMLTGNRDPKQRERFYHTFRAIAKEMMVRDTALLPGTEEILRMLSGQGIKLAVVSTKGKSSIAEIFQRFGLETLFSCIVGFENVSAPKPDPEGLLYALGQLGVCPDEALYVGDTVIDAETARRAGTDFAAVTTGTTEAEAFSPFSCRQITPDLKTLSVWLEQIEV